MAPVPPLLRDASDLGAVLQDLADAAAVAIDTEFHAEGRYYPAPMLLQLATSTGGPWLVDPTDPKVVEALAAPLCEVPRWVVHSGDRDLLILHRLFGRIAAQVDDTQILAGLVSTAWPMSLARLLETWLDVDVDKGETLSDWSCRPLSDAQRHYAAEDVRYLLDLQAVLWSHVDALDRTDIARDACAHLAAEATRDTLSPHAWRDVYTHAKTSQEAATAQALLHWRTTQARDRDKPARYFLSDTLLRRIARQRPTALEALHRDRSIQKGFIRRYGEQIVDLVEQAIPDLDGHVVPAHSPAARRRAWLTWVVTTYATEHAFAPELALPPRVAHALSARHPQDIGDAARAILPSWRFALLRDILPHTFSPHLTLGWKDGEMACYLNPTA